MLHNLCLQRFADVKRTNIHASLLGESYERENIFKNKS